MKKILSLLLSVVLLVVGVYICIPAVADSTLSADDMAKQLGANEENLAWTDDFSTSSIINRIKVAPAYEPNKQVFEVKDGKWLIGAHQGKDLTLNGGWTDISLGDFIACFEFTTKQGWGQSNFYYHSTSGWPDSYDYRLNIFGGAGYKATLTLEKKGDANARDSVSGFDLPLNTEFNIVIISKGTTDSVYMWKKGEEAPVNPTLSITTDGNARGDIYYYTYQDSIALDNINVYELGEMNTAVMKTATGLKLDDADLFYSNIFNDALQAPVSNFDAYIGTNEITNKKWQTTGEVGTSTGLTGQTLQNFALGFQFSINDASNGFYADFAYHSVTGWANLNNENRLNVFGQNGKLTFVLNGKSGVSQYAATNYVQGDIINVILTYIDKEISAYIWKYNEEIPKTPILTIKATEETSGDFYFHLANATFTMDNFYVYNPVFDDSEEIDNNSLLPEDIKAVTGIDFADSDLVYKSQFSNTKIAPVEKFDVYNGSSVISNKKWVTVGEVGTSTGLTGAILENFTLGFQFTVSDIEENAYADFAYHSKTGWANLNNDNRLNMFIIDGKLNFVLSAKDGQSKNVVTDYKPDDLVNVVLTYSDKVAKLYLWRFGDKLPDEPILKVMGTTASQGDIYFHFSRAKFVMDDFYVYNNPVDINQNYEQIDKVLINKDFNTNGDLLFKAEDTGITGTKNGLFEFNTDGHKMLHSPLLADGENAMDFSWQFTYVPSETVWNTDRFKFHCQGDKGSDSVYLQILGSGNAKDGKNLQIVKVLNNKAYVLNSANVDLHRLNSYTVRIISENNNVSVYWWKKGTSTPDKPILTAQSNDVVLEKGGFMIEGFHTVFYIDDMKLYNYASGKQLTTYLPKLPDKVLLTNWDFNNLKGKTDFPFEANYPLKYWQDTLKIETPMKPERKQVTTTNLVGDYELSDLSWEFDIREFEGWAVDKFIIHSLDGTASNSIYLLFTGNAAKVLQDGFNGKDPSNSTLRLIQVIDGKVTVLGTYNEEIARGKGYSIKITSRNNNIEVWFGTKRTGKTEKVISAKADERLSSGKLLIESFNSEMWLDNMKISNCAEGSETAYEKTLYAEVR